MRLKLSADPIDILGKEAGRLKSIVDLARAKRQEMRRTLDQNNRRVDTTLNRIIIRLGHLKGTRT